MANSQYTKISKLALDTDKNLSLSSSILIDGYNLNTKNLSTNLEEVNLSNFAHYNYQLSNLPVESFKVKVDTTNKSTLDINFTLNAPNTNIVIEQNSNIPIFDIIENSWSTPYSFALENIKGDFNYSEILISTYQDEGASINPNKPFFTSLKINNQRLMSIDINLKELTDLEILDNNLYTITLGKFDALKRIKINANNCSGGIYIGKLASEIIEINLGEGQNTFNYIVIEGNNTLLTDNNCNLAQVNPTTFNFINCIISDSLLTNLINAGNKVIIN